MTLDYAMSLSLSSFEALETPLLGRMELLAPLFRFLIHPFSSWSYTTTSCTYNLCSESYSLLTSRSLLFSGLKKKRKEKKKMICTPLQVFKKGLCPPMPQEKPAFLTPLFLSCPQGLGKLPGSLACPLFCHQYLLNSSMFLVHPLFRVLTSPAP